MSIKVERLITYLGSVDYQRHCFDVELETGITPNISKVAYIKMFRDKFIRQVTDILKIIQEVEYEEKNKHSKL